MNFVAQNFATVALVNAGEYVGLRGGSVGVEEKDSEVDAVEKRVVADAVFVVVVVVVLVVVVVVVHVDVDVDADAVDAVAADAAVAD